MKAAHDTFKALGIVGLLLLFLMSDLVFAQRTQRQPRKVVEPANLVYDSEVEGIPILETFIRSSDGLYIPAIVQKPKGTGPFPAVVIVHGAPGGRGLSALKQALPTRNMVGEAFLNDGYVVLTADYRSRQTRGKEGPTELSYAGDVVTTIRYTKQLSYVDAEKVCVYSGSLGSESSILALGEESVAAAVLNAPGGFTTLRVNREAITRERNTGAMLADDMIDREVAVAYLGKINSPVLFTVGTADNFQSTVKKTHAILKELGKDAYIDVYPGEKHGFYFGPRKVDGKYEPSPAFAKALKKAVAFCGERVK
jgi:uncharacterized protein